NCVRVGTMRTAKWLSCVWAAWLTGCSLYPIPDDVTSISTEDIVRHGRCEIRSAVIDYVIAKGLVGPSATEADVMTLFKATAAKVKARSSLNPTEKYIVKLAGVAVV